MGRSQLLCCVHRPTGERDAMRGQGLLKPIESEEQRKVFHDILRNSIGAIIKLQEQVGWVLDADLRAFFDTLSHEWLVTFIEHRIADRRIIRLIRKWLKAGVLEEGKRIRKEEGTAQGGSISPLLSNIYLHYVLDLWVHGGETIMPAEMSSSCDMPMTLFWAFSIDTRRSVFWLSCSSDWLGSS